MNPNYKTCTDVDLHGLLPQYLSLAFVIWIALSTVIAYLRYVFSSGYSIVWFISTIILPSTACHRTHLLYVLPDSWYYVIFIVNTVAELRVTIIWGLSPPHYSDYRLHKRTEDEKYSQLYEFVEEKHPVVTLCKNFSM